MVFWYGSANRDEEVFEDADRFELQRNPNFHLSFGHGPHFCLGASLARLELRVIFDTLLAHNVHVESAGSPEWVRSNFVNA